MKLPIELNIEPSEAAKREKIRLLLGIPEGFQCQPGRVQIILTDGKFVILNIECLRIGNTAPLVVGQSDFREAVHFPLFKRYGNNLPGGNNPVDRGGQQRFPIQSRLFDNNSTDGIFRQSERGNPADWTVIEPHL